MRFITTFVHWYHAPNIKNGMWPELLFPDHGGDSKGCIALLRQVHFHLKEPIVRALSQVAKSVSKCQATSEPQEITSDLLVVQPQSGPRSSKTCQLSVSQGCW